MAPQKSKTNVAVNLILLGISTSELGQDYKTYRISKQQQHLVHSEILSNNTAAVALTGDDNFGLHISESVNLSAFDVVGYCALNSSTLGAAFARVARYHSIWTDGALFTLETADDTSAIVYRYSDPSIREHRQDSEMTLATVRILCRSIATRLRSDDVEFQHAAPADLSEHCRLLNCPVKFGATRHALSARTADGHLRSRLFARLLRIEFLSPRLQALDRRYAK